MEEETSCRTCRQPTNKSNCEELSQLISNQVNEKISITQMLKFCFPSMKLNYTELTMICHSCLNSLKISYSFKKMCLETEKKLNCDKKLNKSILENMDIKSQDSRKGNVDQDIKNNNIKKKKKFLVYRKRFKNNNCYGCANQLLDVLFHCSTPTEDNCICMKCGKSFDGVPEIRKHMHSHDLKLTATCNICGKKHRDSYQLRKHLLSHTKERPYECPICSQKFASQYIRNIHLQKHRDKEFLTCPTCKKQFSTKYNLNVHIKSIEDSSRPVCLKCHKKFPSQKALSTHTCFKQDPYLMCSICGKYLANKHSLQLHLLAHNPVRPTCTHCKKWFYKEKQLDNHQLTCYTQEKKQRLERVSVKEESMQFDFPDLVEIKKEDIAKNYDDEDDDLFDETNDDQDDYFVEDPSVIKADIKNEEAQTEEDDDDELINEELIDVGF